MADTRTYHAHGKMHVDGKMAGDKKYIGHQGKGEKPMHESGNAPKNESNHKSIKNEC
jgi:hypothetical protein